MVEYVYVCAVAVESGPYAEKLVCGTMEDLPLESGMAVVLSNGTRGTVRTVALLDKNGPEFDLLSCFTEFHEVVAVYRKIWEGC